MASKLCGFGLKQNTTKLIIFGPWTDRRFGVGEALYASLGIPREDKRGRLAQFMDNYRGFGAPVMLFLHCSRIMGPPQWADMGMWLQSVMLLLVEHGLASCPQECWAMYGATVRRTIGLGDDQILFTGLAIGYADEDAAVNQWPVPRAPRRRCAFGCIRSLSSSRSGCRRCSTWCAPPRRRRARRRRSVKLRRRRSGKRRGPGALHRHRAPGPCIP